MANKKQRINALIQKNISDIVLFELKNPLMRLVSINSVETTNDFSIAKVYVSHLERKSIEESVVQLNKAKGFIRSELAKRMDIYKVPELIFFRDETYDNAEKIENLIKEVNKK